MPEHAKTEKFKDLLLALEEDKIDEAIQDRLDGLAKKSPVKNMGKEKGDGQEINSDQAMAYMD